LTPLWQTEQILATGRADAVNNVVKIVIELKPNNPAALQKGADQLMRYYQSLPCYQLQLQPYNLIEKPGDFYPIILK